MQFNVRAQKIPFSGSFPYHDIVLSVHRSVGDSNECYFLWKDVIKPT
ncbi:hypothetical protein SLEP1_g7171 [Rubroshorea leprosula]|uniref:Uncharacterized protein n=1 Tax=Rubroshorea leprosula TaxID=152421 RepID=A0AAV5I7F5_9ROSI|nr:hypothetical protein SLEP1_g7171 [Rubroshorea leprosula]